jgi:hypothetical protein
MRSEMSTDESEGLSVPRPRVDGLDVRECLSGLAIVAWHSEADTHCTLVAHPGGPTSRPLSLDVSYLACYTVIPSID